MDATISIPVTSAQTASQGVRASPDSLDLAVRRGRDHLLDLQEPDGHWRGELEGDAILEAEYILTRVFLGEHQSDRILKAARHLRSTQNSDGGWSTFPGGPADVNPTVKAYFALKLAGDQADEGHMAAARRRALELGGLPACNSFTRIYLAVFGQVPWERCPAVPPELVLLPSWFPFNIYHMSSWSRAIVVPLSLIWALRPSCEVPSRCSIDELMVAGEPQDVETSSVVEAFWRRFFALTDTAFKLYERTPIAPLRRLAIARGRAWIESHLAGSDGLAAIFPPIVNTIFAFRALGLENDHPLLASQVAELDRLTIEGDGSLRVQPCFSPVWDTVIAVTALREAGVRADDARLLEAGRWIVDREARVRGDWAVRNASVTIGGWYFEYANEPYPDCDDTAHALTSLSQLEFPDSSDRARAEAAIERGAAWLRGMQNRNGGWASFDKDCDRRYLTYVPFADHNAMIDPATVDVTARAVEALAALGVAAGDPALQRAVDFILAEQEDDGSWYGRWGCNYIYGTWLALTALAAVDADRGAIRHGVAWLLGCQNRDGGWGETPASYDDPGLKGRGPSTCSQTGWALLGLRAAGLSLDDPAIKRGILYLLEQQQDNGGWRDDYWTGTGFPRVFYLNYHLYATQYALQALAACAAVPQHRVTEELAAVRKEMV